ncbi:hypothetical protein EVG20_g4232 [Dentipellis fragilis]|uniref:Magnesium-dependent phosphatase-1 n=1 Tax=Dentipellis fragilis TaxID=205917 RepID=A0A4Y9YW89_9AGAM|nr:hypothetical protein EVG20_g4232 [Dentipellis fragilis]
MTSRLPKLVAFDLEHNHKIEFYHDVAEILHRLRGSGVIIAACSRTSAPGLARQTLSLLLVPPKAGDKHSKPMKAIEFFDQMEIYPGSKMKHFRQLHKKTGIPYTEMLFFDDEHRNKEVEELGVTFTLIRTALDDRTFEGGLDEWRRRHVVEVVEDAAGDDVKGI